MARTRWFLACCTAFAVIGAGAARAVPIVDLVVVSQTATQATVRVDLTTPDAGLYIYSISARFSGGLTFSSGVNTPPSPLWENGNFNNGVGGPGIVANIHGLPLTWPMPPIGVGGETFSVAELTFDLNGLGGLVEIGVFNVGIDGFFGPDGLLEDGEFDAQQLGAVQFGSLQLIPEPASAWLVALGLVALAGRSGRQRGSA